MFKLFHTKRIQPSIASGRNQSGFTLIETFVGISLLLVVVTAVLSLSANNIFLSGSAREQVTASYLAQEAIEIVRNVRDNNALQGVSWLTGLSACVVGICQIDPTTVVNPASRCGTSCPQLKINDDNIYQYRSGRDSAFRREVTIDHHNIDTEAIVTARVFWTERNKERSFVVQDHLFNWE